MVQKRPFVEELYEVSSKHPRQLEHSGQLVSFLEFPYEAVARKPHTSGESECGFMKSVTEHDEKLGSVDITELPICTEKDIENSLPGCISSSSWATSGSSEEDVRLEAPFNILVSPEISNSDRPIRTLVQSEEIFSQLDQLPRKPVSIGPNFQADIPEWCPQSAKNTSNCSDSADTLSLSPLASEPNLINCIDDGNMFAGTCVIPMPEVEPSECNGDDIGNGRASCFCEDPGSIRCVRQHILEERENLRRALGQERFAELGFCDMGEVEAKKWSEEAQQLFQEVVFSYPASLGNNFWDHLSIVFPFRTRREIVSYYFNVFMLQKRAWQNRRDPMNIDSDDDEWQGSDDEEESFNEDEDSVVESPAYQDDLGRNNVKEEDSQEYDECLLYYNDVDFGGFKGTGVSETHPRKVLNNYNSDSMFQSLEKILLDGRGGRDFQDDSSSSSDTVAAPQVSQVKVGKQWNGMSGGNGHEFFFESCDAKQWDIGYLTCPSSEVDFLPTCSMIEEVFGIEDWNYNAGDGKGLS